MIEASYTWNEDNLPNVDYYLSYSSDVQSKCLSIVAVYVNLEFILQQLCSISLG